MRMYYLASVPEMRVLLFFFAEVTVAVPVAWEGRL